MISNALRALPSLAVAAAFGVAHAWAQASPAYEPPRTPDGRPDFQGVWSTASATSLERPAGYPLVITPQQAAELEGRTLFNQRIKTEASFVDPKEGAPEKGRPLPPVGNYDVAYTDPGSRMISIGGELRSSWIVYPADGKIPAMTEQGKALRAANPGRRGSGYDNPEERGLGERCLLLSGGPPFRSGLYNNNIQIVQTPAHLMMMVEMVHDARIVRVNGTHADNGVEPWMGDSIATWNGDTLVIETTNIHAGQRADRVFMSASGKITERLTRISNDQILYQFEVNDPAVYADVWRAEIGLNRLEEPMFEYACHEGNYGLYNILSGGRQNDRSGAANTDGDKREE